MPLMPMTPHIKARDRQTAAINTATLHIVLCKPGSGTIASCMVPGTDAVSGTASITGPPQAAREVLNVTVRIRPYV